MLGFKPMTTGPTLHRQTLVRNHVANSAHPPGPVCMKRQAIIEEKTNTCTDRRRLTNHWIPQIIQANLDSRIMIHHNQHTQRGGDRKISNEKGSLAITDICNNFSELCLNLKPIVKAVATRCPFSTFRRHVTCIVGKTRYFPDLKINTSL